jgi:hypothetical protein
MGKPKQKWVTGLFLEVKSCRSPRKAHNLTAICEPFVYNSGSQALFVRVPPDVISLKRRTPKIVAVYFKLYTFHNLHLK